MQTIEQNQPETMQHPDHSGITAEIIAGIGALASLDLAVNKPGWIRNISPQDVIAGDSLSESLGLPGEREPHTDDWLTDEDRTATQAAIKRITKEQKEHQKKRLAEAEQEENPEARRALVLDAWTHNPDTAKRVVGFLNERAKRTPSSRPYSSPDNPVMSDDEIIEASESSKGFQRAVEWCTTLRPRLILERGTKEILESMVDKNALTQSVVSMADADPDSFVYHLEDIRDIIDDPEAFEGAVQKAERNLPEQTLERLTQMVIDEKAAGKPSSQMEDLARSMLVRMRDKPLNAETLANIIQAKIWTKEEVTKQVSGVASTAHGISYYNDFGYDRLSKVISPEMAETAKQAAITAIEDNPKMLCRVAEIDSNQFHNDELVTNGGVMSPELLNKTAEKLLTEPTQSFGFFTGEYLSELTPEIGSRVIDRIIELSTDYYPSEEIMEKASDEQLGSILGNFTQHKPGFLLSVVENNERALAIVCAMPPDNKLEIMGRLSTYNLIKSSETLETIGVPAEIVAQQIKYSFDRSPDMSSLVSITDKGLLPPDDISGMRDRLVEAVASGETRPEQFVANRDLDIEVFSDEELTAAIAAIGEANPAAGFACALKNRGYYSKTEIEKIISTAISDHLDDDLLLSEVFANVYSGKEPIVSIVGGSRVADFVQGLSSKQLDGIAYRQNKIAATIGVEGTKALAHKIVQENPASLLLEEFRDFYASFYPDFDPDSFKVEDLPENTEVKDLGGKYLVDKWKKLQSSTSEIRRSEIATELSSLYQKINDIKLNGNAEGAQKIVDSLNGTKVSRREVIGSLWLFTELGENMPESVEAYSDLEEMLVVSLADKLGMEEPNKEQVKLLVESGFRVYSFGVYANEHMNPAHKEVLGAILKSSLDENFTEWKYGGDTEDDLEHLKSSGLVPESLTLDQYLAWQHDETTETSIGLELGASTALAAISDTMTGYQPELLMTAAETDYQEIKGELQSMGKTFGQVHGKLKRLRVLRDDALEGSREYSRISLSIDELDEEIKDLNQEKSQLQQLFDVKTLLDLSLNQINAGKVQDEKGRDRDIGDLLNRLSKNTPKSYAFIIGSVEDTLENFRKQNSGVMNVSVVDTADLSTTIEIGAYPAASCQHFDGGVVNEALLGYTEPTTKLLVAKNDKGTPVARSVFRLMTNSEGQTSLHLENVYAAELSDGVISAILMAAHAKAQAMGVSLFVSSKSQDAAGNMIPNIFATSPIPQKSTDTKLRSTASIRAPSIYVDSNGGSTQRQYTLNKLALIE